MPTRSPKVVVIAVVVQVALLLAFFQTAVLQGENRPVGRLRVVDVTSSPATTLAPVSASLQVANLSLTSAFDEVPVAADVTALPRRRLVLFWTRFFRKSFENFMNLSFPRSERCGQLCQLTYDREQVRDADVVLFHAVNVNFSQLPGVRSAAQLWALYNVEPPTHHFVRPAHDGLFNLTMTHRRDSDIEVGYGHSEELGTQANLRSPENRPLLLSLAANFSNRKPYAYWMVSNCKSARMDYVQELSKHIQVDIYGKCAPNGTRSCSGNTDATVETDCERELSAAYVFYLAFENSLCPDYITEKLWRTLASPGGAIPVVMGATPSRYTQVAPPGSFVHAASFPSLHELAKHLKRIASDRDLFMSYHSWRERYRVHVGWYFELASGLCNLCELMHSEKTDRWRPAKANLYSWFSSGCATDWQSGDSQVLQ